MKKLGLVINRVETGSERLFARNTDGWEARLSDEWQRMDHLMFPDNHAPIFHIVSFTPEGCFFRMLDVTNASAREYICACLFVPSGVKPDQEDLNGIFETLSEVIESPEAYLESLAPYFEKEYQPEGPAYPTPRSLNLAYRFYSLNPNSGVTFRNLLENFYQACYSEYESVILIDKGSGIIIKPESNSADLTDRQLSAPIILRKVVTSGRVQPTKIYVNDAFYTGSPIFVGGLVDVKFEHPQFATILCRQCRVPDSGIIAIQLNWKKKYTSEVIKVVDSTSLSVEGCEITVNGQMLPVYLSEEEARHAEIAVSRKGYLSAREVKDLWTYPNVRIVLEKEHLNREFIIESVTDKSAGCVSFEMDMPDIPRKSPIEGYRLGRNRGDQVHLVYDEFGFIRNPRSILVASVAFVLSLIIGAFIGYAIAHSVFEKQVNPEKKEKIREDKQRAREERQEEGVRELTPEELAARAEEERIAALAASAASYLSSNPKWTKGVLDSNELTRGLFNAINTYDVAAIEAISVKVPDFDWDPLCTAVANGAEKAREKTGRNTYCANSADTTLTIAGYINYLNELVNPAPAPAQ